VPRKFCPVGKLLPGVQIVIMDAEMNAEPVGVRGEVCIEGPSHFCTVFHIKYHIVSPWFSEFRA
jgi:acyl-coenzyme A synthetase/AMP-(fatty) acid ligase